MMIPSPKSSWAFPLRAAIRLAVCLAFALLFAGCRSTASPGNPSAIPDNLGSVTAATDRAGAVVERYAYDDFGSPTIYAPDGSTVRTHSLIDNDVLFAGARWHADLGLYWMRYRWYDPATGRFLTQDPIGLWGDPFNLGNGMAYAGHSPRTWVDPSGLKGFCESITDWAWGPRLDPLAGLGLGTLNHHDLEIQADISNLQRAGLGAAAARVADNAAAAADLGEAVIRELNGTDAVLSIGEGLSALGDGHWRYGAALIAAGVLPGVAGTIVNKLDGAMRRGGHGAIDDVIPDLSVSNDAVIPSVAGFCEAPAIPDSAAAAPLASRPPPSRKYEVGIYKDLQGVEEGLDAHHVGKKKGMERFVPNYDERTAPVILVPLVGHARRSPVTRPVVSRNLRNVDSARSLVAGDVRELRRVYPDIPNASLHELIELNVLIYPDAFKKPPRGTNLLEEAP